MSVGWIDILQLLLAAVFGVAVGFVRELQHKPAGTTTMPLVTICATLLMQLSFKLPASEGMGLGDPARLAAAVITGVGFLGAGAIIRRGVHVDGLTSAATIWIMSAVGLAIGASYYLPAVVVVLLILSGFAANRPVERLVARIQLRQGWKKPPPEQDNGDGQGLL